MEARNLFRFPLSIRPCLQLRSHTHRAFTTTSSVPATGQDPGSPTTGSRPGLADLATAVTAPGSFSDDDLLGQYEGEQAKGHRLSVFSHKHNTHMTLFGPFKDNKKGSSAFVNKAIISVSAGNIGFRKAARGSYDAGYQLGAYMMNRIQQQGLMTQIEKVELVLRGFGQGREAVTKILMGSEGAAFRPKIVRVVDATRLKFGGTRSPKPRRLG